MNLKKIVIYGIFISIFLTISIFFLKPESIRKTAEANRGKKRSAEARRKMSEARSGFKHHMFGKKHSAETKKKMSIREI